MVLRKGFTHSFYIEIPVCLTIIILGCIALFVPPKQAANLPVVPDEGQYAMSASNLFSKWSYSVTLNHRDYPALYPYGFPLILQPAFYLWGPFVGNVTYMNFVLNMGTVILTYMIGRMVGGLAVGCIAALFLLGNHLFLRSSHLIMSQGAVACFFVLATLLLLRVQDQRDAPLRLGILVGVGVVAGCLSSLHASWVCLDAAIIVALYLIYRKSWRKLIGALLVVGGITFVFIAVQLEYNQQTFGRFLHSGYEYWNEIPAPQFFSIERVLSFDFGQLYDAITIPSLTRLRRFFNSNNLTYYVSSLLGLHAHSVLYSPIATILIGLGAYELLKNRHDGRGHLLVALTLVTSGSLIIVFAPYYFQATRFLLPMLPLVGVMASVGLVSIYKRSCQRSAGKVAVMVGVVLGLLFFGSLSYTYARTGIQYDGQAEFGKRNGRIRMAKYVCAQTYNSLAEGNAVIASALDINYISHFVLMGTERSYLPLVRNIAYVSRNPQLANQNWRPLGLPVVEENPQTLFSILQAGLPVYSDNLEESNFKEQYAALRSSFDWHDVGKCASFHIYRLHMKKSS